jgi:hypothetical protein
MHYEIEQAGRGPDVATHARPRRWHVVNVPTADARGVLEPEA